MRPRDPLFINESERVLSEYAFDRADEAAIPASSLWILNSSPDEMNASKLQRSLTKVDLLH